MATLEKKKAIRKEVISVIEQGGLKWVHIEKPTQNAATFLEDNYHFHPLNLDDVLARNQRPKIDNYSNHLFIILHFPIYNKEYRVTTASEMDIFIGDGYLVTVDCAGNLKALDKFFKMCQTDDKIREDSFTNGSGYLLYLIIDRLVDYCLPMINKVGDNIESVEDGVFDDQARGTVKEISILRRDIISFRRSIWPIRGVIGSLEPKIRRFTTMDTSDYFGDLVDHLDKIWDALIEYKEIIEGLSDTYDSLSSNRINDILRVLTILTVIGTMLTIVVGFYGMNIPLPFGQDPGGNPVTWFILLIVMLILTMIMMFYFHRKHWL